MFHRAEFLGPSLKTAMQVAAHQQDDGDKSKVTDSCPSFLWHSCTSSDFVTAWEKKISCFEWDGCSRNSSGFSSKFDPDFHLVAKVTDSLEDSCHSEVSGPRPGGIRGVV
uniref:Uncharacterized protein n=1 Tax=Setaria viridis TaxID=4556 RepID=A0A4U6SX63_SETVI|nr:hypothetical protein SEVIR_9G179000v2 [Setaria viridis]